MAPKWGLAGYQTLLTSYLSEGLRRDEARFNLYGQQRLTVGSCTENTHSVPQELLDGAVREVAL